LRVALVSGQLHPGNPTTFLCDLAGEFNRRQIPGTIVSPENEIPFATVYSYYTIIAE
jgi:hypothetical protein